METLKIKNVSLTYQTPQGETSALKDINLSVESGEFVSIIGPSGCGKTTILSLIAGLMKPSSGKIYLENKEITGTSGDIGYMLQRDQLFEWRNIFSNAVLGLEIQKENSSENVKYVSDMLDKYGLGDFKKSMPYQLSGGMRQRAALIRTLAFRPKLLLLDEPFSALDYQTRLTVCDDVHHIIKTEKKTVVMVTHDISDVMHSYCRLIF